MTINGAYFSSRMIGDYVYVVINEPAYLINETTIRLPEIRVDNSGVTIEASDIYHTEEPDAYDLFTTLVALNVQNPEAEPTVEIFLLGATSCLYVSKANIYLTAPTYSTSGTNIHKIHIGRGISYVADGVVPGYVLNQFSMDEDAGFFRIAT